MDPHVASLINDQINYELFSAYLYFDMEHAYVEKNLDGFAHWFHVQAKEELDHAYLFCRYLHNNEERVLLQSIQQPSAAYSSAASALEAAYTHEKKVTEQIHQIYATALEAKDFRTMQFLLWFIEEQGEEEQSTKDVLDKAQLFGNDPKLLYLLDKELAARTYAPPSFTL